MKSLSFKEEKLRYQDLYKCQKHYTYGTNIFSMLVEKALLAEETTKSIIKVTNQSINYFPQNPP